MNKKILAITLAAFIAAVQPIKADYAVTKLLATAALMALAIPTLDALTEDITVSWERTHATGNTFDKMAELRETFFEALKIKSPMYGTRSENQRKTLNWLLVAAPLAAGALLAAPVEYFGRRS